MKFSDMMGNSGGDPTSTDAAEAADVGGIGTVAEVPEIASTATAPVELSGNRSEMEAVLGELQAYAPPAPTAEPAEPVETSDLSETGEPGGESPAAPDAASVEVLPTDDVADPSMLAPPSIADVMTELTPTATAPATTGDPASWLDNLGLVDDDLLPSS